MDMSEAQVIAKLVEALEKLQRPAIPLSVDLWDMATIAQYLKRDAGTVRERMACLPSFPKAIRLPTSKGRAQPLYNAKEIIAWAESYREKN
jgi:predicted transcriptional regulator